MTDEFDGAESPFSPRNQAIAIIRAKFAGLVPETITVEECLELMTLFARYESDRADTAIGLLTCGPVSMESLEYLECPGCLGNSSDPRDHSSHCRVYKASQRSH